jgi:Tol biopolymer transport system component
MRYITVAVAALLAAIGVTPASADVIQVTNLPAARTTSVPSLSADGRYTTFSTNGNVAGLNPGGVNVFVYESITNMYTLVTTLGGQDPSISANGRWIAFTTSADYVRTNPDGSDEIVRYDRIGRHFYQVTRDINGDGSSAHPSVNGDGTRITFETNSNLTRRNPDFSNEVILYRLPYNLMVTNDVDAIGESLQPAISANGRFVVFQSTSDLVGHNADFSQELMVYDYLQRRVLQLTNDPAGNGASGPASISADGQFIAFVSSSNIGNVNPEFASAIFLMNRFRPSVISKTAAGVFDGDTPTVSDDGRWVAFSATFNATGGNPDHNTEILLYDSTRKTFTQLTDTAACANTNPRISADGTHIAFTSTCDITGGNADKSREVFLADNPALKLQVHSEGPVNTEVRDPLDRIVRSNLNLIPGSMYEQGDFDNDTQPEVRVSIPKALDGPYRMTLFPNLGAALSDPVSLDVSLNGITVFLASDTVGTLAGNEFSFNIQGFSRPRGSIAPVSGVRSLVTFAGGLILPPSSLTGPVTLRVTDGNNEVFFDLGLLENFPVLGSRRLFRGTVNGFTVTMLIYQLADGSVRMSFIGRGGDLTMFAGSDHVGVTVVLQIGPDAYLYQRRFIRLRTGGLVLQ